MTGPDIIIWLGIGLVLVAALLLWALCGLGGDE